MKSKPKRDRTEEYQIIKNKLLAWTDGVVAQCDYMTLRENILTVNLSSHIIRLLGFQK